MAFGILNFARRLALAALLRYGCPVALKSIEFLLCLLLCWSRSALADATNSNHKALVICPGDPQREPDAFITHAQAAKENFLKFVGNPSNDPTKGWTCDLSWELMERLGMDPARTSTEELFAYLGKHRLGYRIAMRNLGSSANDSFWGVAVDNGIMPFAPHGENTPGKRMEYAPGLQPCVAVAGGRSVCETTYGPSLEFFDAVPSGPGGIWEDTAQSWANQMLAAKFAKILDRHPEYNIWDARQHLRQAASFWDNGWTERNGYGRVDLNARVGKLQPAPPLEFRATVARNGRQVIFTWRNFLMSDFAATVIARDDGRILYEGTGTGFTWTTDKDVPTSFLFWSKNKAGDKSRLESFQRTSVADLSFRGQPSCLAFAEPGPSSSGAMEMLSVFQAAATNWIADLACRPGSESAKFVGLFNRQSLYAVVLPDFEAMVDYAITTRYPVALVPQREAPGLPLNPYPSLWRRALAAGVAVVTPYSPLPSARPGAAITVAYADGTNAYTHGSGLEFMDAAADPPNNVGLFAFSETAAAATIAAKVAHIMDRHPQYNLFDTRQHLRQSASFYAAGWRENGGYGRPPLETVEIASLDLAPPLEIQAVRSADGESVVFSWLNFEQAGFAATVIFQADGAKLYEGQGTSFVWRSNVNGDAAFKFHTRGKSGRLSRDEPYTLIHLEGLKSP